MIKIILEWTKSNKKDKENNAIIEELKEYRKMKSKEENIRPYYIYNDLQLKELIEKKPKTLQELIKINGFGKKKVEKYGEDIINILNKNK